MLFRSLTLVAFQAFGATKVHVLSLAKPATVQWFVGPEGNKPYELKVRPLFVDGRLKEYTTGPQHEVTERMFVVRRMFRLNDSLPPGCRSTLAMAARRMVVG